MSSAAERSAVMHVVVGNCTGLKRADRASASASADVRAPTVAPTPIAERRPPERRSPSADRPSLEPRAPSAERPAPTPSPEPESRRRSTIPHALYASSEGLGPAHGPQAAERADAAVHRAAPDPRGHQPAGVRHAARARVDGAVSRSARSPRSITSCRRAISGGRSWT